MNARFVRLAAVIGLSIGIGICAGPAQAGVSQQPNVKPEVARATGPHGASATKTTSRLWRQGYLVPDQRRYERAKARANARAGALSVQSPFAGSAPKAPAAVRSWHGVNDSNVAPSDSTGAVGTARFIETVNDKFAIYDKTSDTPLSTGTLQAFWNSGARTTDPQVMWDPDTRRFYYAGLDITNSSNNVLMFGYSKTASPNDETDFCHYQLGGFGALVPDYPKLGDMRGHIILGVNVFSGNSYVGSDGLTVSKPPTGTTCVDPATFGVGFRAGLLDADGSTFAFTPEPANQTDKSKTGFIVATEGQGISPSQKLTVFKITTKADGSTNIPAQGKTVTVPSYSIPPNAPQSGTNNLLDTLDGRLTQTVSAIDPGHLNAVGLWTEQTVAGGAGAEVRWYEIDPKALTVLQSGAATSPTLFEFNGATSPNRAVNGPSASGGKNMVMGFNTSSSTTFPAIKAISKIGANPQSAPLTIITSPNSDVGFDCDDAQSPNLCRWGDYAGATPDPNPASGSLIWLVSMFNNGTSTVSSTWKTQNFAVSP